MTLLRRYPRVRTLGGAAVCMLAWQCAPAAAQDTRLGRLFFTPEERQRLDQKRGAPAAASAPQTVMVNGVIIRPGMSPILFLDGKEVRQGEGPAGVSLAAQPNRSVRMQAEGSPPVSVQPGQVVDLSSGRTFENYQLAAPPRAAPAEPLPTSDQSTPTAQTKSVAKEKSTGNATPKPSIRQ